MNVIQNLTTLRRVKLLLRMPVATNARGGLALSGVVASDTCVVAGVTFTAGTSYTVKASDTLTAVELANALNANATVHEVLSAVPDGASVELESQVAGAIGNLIPLVGSTHIVVTPMAGGTATPASGDTTDDELLENLISGASCDFAEAIGYDPNFQARVEVYTARGTYLPSVTLPDLPEIDLTSLEFNDVALTADDYFQEGPIVYLDNLDYDTNNTLEVTFDYGFASMPEDIIQCVTTMAASAWKLRDHIGERSNSSPDGMSTTFLAESELPAVTAVIQRYRRMF
jgi:hypothetical protein